MTEIEKELAQSIGTECRATRLDRGWSQEEVSKFADVNAVYYSRIEQGTALPSLQTLVRLGRVFRVSLNRLVYSRLDDILPAFPLLRPQTDEPTDD